MMLLVQLPMYALHEAEKPLPSLTTARNDAELPSDKKCKTLDAFPTEKRPRTDMLLPKSTCSTMLIA
jgi:hypothetical protein